MPKQTKTACHHQACTADKQDTWLTWPNLVTLVRTVGAVVLIALAVAQNSTLLLFVGLAVYWVGDMADGALARLIHAETRTGATFDILSDRLCVAMFYVTYGVLHHDMLLPIAIFLLNFMLIDNMLSLAFLRWPIMSPNYFYKVDRLIYRLNWSPIAKATNTSLFLIIVVVTKSWLLAAVVATMQLAVKIYSSWLLTSVPAPHGHSNCIERDHIARDIVLRFIYRVRSSDLRNRGRAAQRRRWSNQNRSVTDRRL